MNVQAGVLLHFPVPPARADLESVEQTLLRLHGVERVSRGRKLGNVMLVDYDPAAVSPAAIRDACRALTIGGTSLPAGGIGSRLAPPMLFPARRLRKLPLG